MKFSQLLFPACAASALAHSDAHNHHHDAHRSHGLAGVCGSGALPLSDGESTCGSDTEYLAAGHNDVFAQKPLDGIWRCPNGTECDYAHKHNWTHSSPCFTSPTTGTEFCVFTDAEFAEGRGTSFVMPARRADYIATTPAFVEPDRVKGVNQDLKRIVPAKYDMKEFPGKGMGLVANTYIQRGDLIMANTLSLMIDYRVFDELTWDEYAQLQAFAVDYLPDAHRAAIMNLSTHDGGNLTHVATVDKITATNAFDIDPDADDEQQDHGFFVVFPEIARMNHDCRANADYYFDHETLTQYIHATRPISPGEELTLSYINPLMRREARLRKLQRTWGFKCACPLCTQEAGRAKASDARIKQIRELRGQFRSYKPESLANPQMAELFISLHEQEKLWGAMYEAYAFAALEYNGIGEPWTATKWAQLAVEWGIPAVGEKDQDVIEMQKLAEDPWAHWSWMLRSKKRAGWGRKDGEEEEDDEY
ncbi:hypothetical protein B0T25DRAFT_164645 [Lasiosphaeria hispida]|uniref:SET domain-containing protein n=1 Tax=Lasiosphaeria hispida TaxID=260671 RepID=A0AAJ0HMH1_9PEZI|nr:hypothetical protein B0T25DRAFT_164645 [Lasiosphaeria hispida]